MQIQFGVVPRFLCVATLFTTFLCKGEFIVLQIFCIPFIAKGEFD